MIIFLSDTDGDDVAIDARSIAAVTVGSLRDPVSGSGFQVSGDGERADIPRNPKPRTQNPTLRVTLVHTLAGPLVVAQSLEQVVDAWQGALRAEDALAYLDRVMEAPADAS